MLWAFACIRVSLQIPNRILILGTQQRKTSMGNKAWEPETAGSSRFVNVGTCQSMSSKPQTPRTVRLTLRSTPPCAKHCAVHPSGLISLSNAAPSGEGIGIYVPVGIGSLFTLFFEHSVPRAQACAIWGSPCLGGRLLKVRSSQKPI